MSVLFHIDVNSAFLSWTAASLPVDEAHPDLRTIPSIVGGDEKTRHGIVLAKSTPAKAYGIHTAETIASAMKKCPGLVVVPPDHALYRRRSRELMQLLCTFTPDIEQVSVDECYMDFTPIAHLYSSPEEAAGLIRSRVRNELGFTVNVGISVNRLLAKMASDFTKPDRTHTLFPEEIPSKMWPLQVDDLFMVGKSSAGRLHALGIHTIGDLAHADPLFLEAHFKSHGSMMHRFANGIASDRIRTQREEAKGIGNSTTLPADAKTEEEADAVLLRLSRKVSDRLRSHEKQASCVTVEIKYHDFVSTSHQTMLPSPVDDSAEIHQTALRLFRECWNEEPVRLLGIRTTHLTDRNAPVQMTLFDLSLTEEASASKTVNKVSPEKHRRAEQAADQIRKRFGDSAIVRGSVLQPGETPRTSGNHE